jgi:predicted naringenin-chalcone synthase
MGLQKFQTIASHDVLKKYGNMSSATLPHVWKELESVCKPNDVIVSLAFGPGLSLCGAIFKRV